MSPRSLRLAAPLLISLMTACSSAPPPPPAAPIAPSTPTPPIPPAGEAKLSVEQAVTRFFTAPVLREEWFAPQFLAAVPLAKIQSIRDQSAARGAFPEPRAQGPAIRGGLREGRVAVTASLDAEGRFTSLLLKPVVGVPKSIEEALDPFQKLPGKVSVLVLDGATTLGALEPDAPLAVGSTFKLATLAALRAQVDTKQRSWRDVVELSWRARSLPSGILQDWPDGAPLTLYTLAALMISRSDNTATDTLIRLVGRKAIEPLAARNRPYLMTRDMFHLKTPGNEALLARYRAGDEAARRALLDELANTPPPAAKDYPKEPTALDVEWFFTARELCALMAKVADLPFMTINPGVAEKGKFTRVAYKGGSEPGVLNTTTWLEKGSHAYCVSTTWNAPQALDENVFFQADQGVFHYLAALP